MSGNSRAQVDPGGVRGFCERILAMSQRYFDRPMEPGRLSKAKPRNLGNWQEEYRGKLATKSFYHDEPWMTLVALWGLLGDQTDKAASGLTPPLYALAVARSNAAVNAALARAFTGRGAPVVPRLRGRTRGYIEVQLPENILYRKYLRTVLGATSPRHPYHDRDVTLARKLAAKNASFEGNTNLDALISGVSESQAPVYVFVEAKFLSDIDTQVTYAVARNQIARNIDCALDVLTHRGENGERDMAAIDRFWFVLLTPGMFRTAEYGGYTGGNPGYVDALQTQHSRLYCYTMNRYLDPVALRRDLPHWDGLLSDEDWASICRRIGWLTFEDILAVVLAGSSLSGEDKMLFRSFFEQRGIVLPRDSADARAVSPPTASAEPAGGSERVIDTPQQGNWLRAFTRAIRNAAPELESVGGRSSRRISGQLSHDRECNAFAAIHIFIEKGLAKHRTSLQRIAQRIASVQSALHGPYPVRCYAFGDQQAAGPSDNPTVVQSLGSTTQVVRTLCELSGDTAPGGPAVLCGVKTRISYEDLVLIICRDPSLAQVAPEAEAMLSRHRRRTFWLCLRCEPAPFFLSEQQRPAARS